MPWLSERIIDPARAGSLAARVRARRWQTFEERFPDLARMSVLDLGGTAGAWRLVPTRPARLVLLNIEEPGELSGAQSAIGDACDPPDWVRREHFDLVFSNSLIEHVGGHWRRQRFAEVVRSLAEHHWVQTPYRYFPLEPHYVGPLFQFVPLAARAAARRSLADRQSRDGEGPGGLPGPGAADRAGEPHGDARLLPRLGATR